MNPRAHILRVTDGAVPLAEVLDTGRYDPDFAASAEGWDEELAGGHTPETEEYGIRSITYVADRPFHPARLTEALEGMRGVLRSKGFCWPASRPDYVVIWSQAGPDLTFEPAALWSELDEMPGQEIVVIGVRLDGDRMRALLDAALLTDAEFEAGRAAWTAHPDPIPAWGELHEHR